MTLRAHLPKSLHSLPAVEVLERSARENRLGHAILLHGPHGKTLEEVAHAAAKHLLESANAPEKHPDFFSLRPVGATRRIKVGTSPNEDNSMRRLVVNLSNSANQQGAKVAIIYEADRMNASSANAFLKTLEEPPPGSYIILLSTQPYHLLDTIRSRCLSFRIGATAVAIADEAWIQWKKDYVSWICDLIDSKNRPSPSDLTFRVYALIAGFQSVLEIISKRESKEALSHLSESAADDLIASTKAGVEKGFQRQLITDVAESTAACVRAIESENTGQLPINAYSQIIKIFHEMMRLSEVNVPLSVVLEYFFLRSLKVWTVR